MVFVVAASNGKSEKPGQSAAIHDAPLGGPVTSGSISPEMAAKLAEIRSRLSTSFAQVTIALMSSPRYRNLSIADLEWAVLDPLLRDRVSIASLKSDNAGAAGNIVGIAIWAKVSDQVSQKIEEQIHAGTFPVRLRGDDWNSGETIWLLDVIATNTELATGVLASFGQIAKDQPVRIHPMVKRFVDPKFLARLAQKQ